MSVLSSKSRLLFQLVNAHFVRRTTNLSTFTSLNKDFGKHVDIVDSNQDILMKSLKSASETSDILSYIRKHHAIMNYTHIIQSLKSIFLLQKSENNNLSNGEVMKSSEFAVLCESLRSRARSLELDDTVDALKVLSFLGVGASTKIMSVLLQLITKQINDLSLHQLIFLDFVIKDFKSTPLVEALKISIPVVFEANLRLKIDDDNVQSLADMLRFATKKNISQVSVDFVIDLLMKHRHNLETKSALSITRSLCDYKETDESLRPLLHHCLDVVLDDLDQCTFVQLESLLFAISNKYSQNNYFFYHEDFIQSVTDYVVRKDCGFEAGVWMLRKCNKMSHINMNLLKYCAKKIETEPWSLESSRTGIVLSLVHAFSIADYRPDNWHILEPLIMNNVTELIDNVELPWMNFLRDMATLGSWPFHLLEKVFDINFLEKYLSRKYNILDYLQLLSVYQAVVSLCPQYKGPLPPPQILQKAISVNGSNVDEFPLSGVLARGLGSDSYFINGVYTKLGHFIHHFFMINKSGIPVSFSLDRKSSEKIYFEDLRMNDHTPVAVIFLPESAYCVNIQRLRGPIRLALSGMEALGITCIPISSVSWEMLLDHEKLPYLMRSITEKCGPLCVQGYT